MVQRQQVYDHSILGTAYDRGYTPKEKMGDDGMKVAHPSEMFFRDNGATKVSGQYQFTNCREI